MTGIDSYARGIRVTKAMCGVTFDAVARMQEMMERARAPAFSNLEFSFLFVFSSFPNLKFYFFLFWAVKVARSVFNVFEFGIPFHYFDGRKVKTSQTKIKTFIFVYPFRISLCRLIKKT